MYDIVHYSRPDPAVIEEIVELVSLLTGRWFTANVPADTRRDLLFQDACCVRADGRIVSVLIFTCLDGDIHITLMATHPEYRGKGIGSQLLVHFNEYTKAMGFPRIVLFTVPPDVKEAYYATVAFYEKMGFTIRKRYTELWESGAIEMVKEL